VATLDRDPAEGVEPTDYLWRKLLLAATARVAKGWLLLGVEREKRLADFSDLGLFTVNREIQWEVALRLRRSPRTNLSDRVLVPGVRRHAL
jgi:hypothetical protein